MASGWTPWIRAGLDTLRERHLFRTLRPISLLPRDKFSPVKVDMRPFDPATHLAFGVDSVLVFNFLGVGHFEVILTPVDTFRACFLQA